MCRHFTKNRPWAGWDPRELSTTFPPQSESATTQVAALFCTRSFLSISPQKPLTGNLLGRCSFCLKHE